MKNALISILFHFCVISSPFVAETEVEPTPAAETEVADGSEETGELPEETPTEEEQPLIDPKDPKVMYHEGDEPIYIYANGGFITGYYALHADGTMASLSEEEYVQFCKNYCTATKKTYYDNYGNQISSDELAAYVTDKARNYYDNDYLAAMAMARTVQEGHSIPPEANFLNIKKFPDIEPDGYRYYYYNGVFYRVTDAVYNDYQNNKDTWYSEEDISSGIYSVGHGAVLIKGTVSASLSGQSMYLTYSDGESITESVVLNPPDYNTEIVLMTGEYTLTAGGLYDDRNYPLDVNLQSFRVIEGKSINLNVSFQTMGETVNLAGYTADEMAEINKSYASPDEFVTPEDIEDYPEAVFMTDSDAITPVPKKSNLGLWIVLGVVGVIVVGGVSVILIRKHNEEMY